MKWLFYVIVLVYMFYRTVYGQAVETAFTTEILNNGEKDFVNVEDNIAMSCGAKNKKVQVVWIDPKGEEVTYETSNRIFVQKHLGGRSLVLSISGAEIEDAGIYSCQIGNLTRNVSLCVFDPVKFVDPITQVITDVQRSITLTCPAKGEPEPIFSWFKDQEPITDEDSSKYRIMQTEYTSEGYVGHLTLMSLQPEDSGLYTCETLQKNPYNDACSHVNSLNITLNVRHAPIFDSNDALVYAQSNINVELRCLANAYPDPTYKWFKDEQNVSYKLEGKLELSGDRNESVLVVNPGIGFGQKYRCEASNKYGSADKFFTLAKIERPSKPSKVQFINATDGTIDFSVEWNSGKLFPVDYFDIQYVQGQPKRRPQNFAWRNKIQTDYTPDQQILIVKDVIVTLAGLLEETDYWVRLRAVNKVGQSEWSDPVPASTTARLEEITTEEPEDTSAQVQQGESDSTFYGIFFAGGILVVAVVCMFAMRMVK